MSSTFAESIAAQYWSQGTIASKDAKISGFIKSQEASSNFVIVF